MVSLREHSVRIPAGSAEIEGVLVLPAAPIGLVLFAHGSGSSRFSPRNVHVARALHARGIGTLLLDLLTLEEDSDYLARFDITLLARRLDAATRWAVPRASACNSSSGTTRLRKPRASMSGAVKVAASSSI